jgi:hypothetical protein
VRTPKRDRPRLPKGYISRAPEGMLTWAAAERILKAFPYLWIATTDADGRPHLVQQWGVWVDGALYFEGSDRTRWARNLARDPRLGFGIQHGDRAVYGAAVVDIVRGVDRTLATKIARQYATKYGREFKYRPKPEQYQEGHVFRARPEKMIAFDVKKFSTSAARFTFPASPVAAARAGRGTAGPSRAPRKAR